jgi:hypothetical protein
MIVRVLKRRANRDFFFDYQSLLKDFPLLEQLSEKQRGNYWTLIYWLKINHPSIGNDLLERHARVKMARMNALNSFFIFLLSLFSFSNPALMTNAAIYNDSVRVYALIGSCIITMLFAFEFYQRQCWFGDIVVKIFASLSRNDKLPRE